MCRSSAKSDKSIILNTLPHDSEMAASVSIWTGHRRGPVLFHFQVISTGLDKPQSPGNTCCIFTHISSLSLFYECMMYWSKPPLGDCFDIWLWLFTAALLRDASPRHTLGLLYTDGSPSVFPLFFVSFYLKLYIYEDSKQYIASRGGYAEVSWHHSIGISPDPSIPFS